MDVFKPEGYLVKENAGYSIDEVRNAVEHGHILEGKAIKCDDALNLYVELGENIVGVIPFNEFEKTVGDRVVKSIAVITKVGRYVKFIPTSNGEIGKDNKTVFELSRKKAQERCFDEYINKLVNGDILDVTVSHAEKYGLFCDIGCGIISLLPIENICVTRINNLKNTFRPMDKLKAVVKHRDELGRILLTHKELLGTWENEVSKFKNGDTVIGTVRSVEEYGAFIELTPNLAGLAEPMDGVKEGDQVTVFIKNIIKETMKVKLLIISYRRGEEYKPKYDYTQASGRIEEWNYSPENSARQIKTVF